MRASEPREVSTSIKNTNESIELFYNDDKLTCKTFDKIVGRSMQLFRRTCRQLDQKRCTFSGNPPRCEDEQLQAFRFVTFSPHVWLVRNLRRALYTRWRTFLSILLTLHGPTCAEEWIFELCETVMMGER